MFVFVGVVSTSLNKSQIKPGIFRNLSALDSSLDFVLFLVTRKNILQLAFSFFVESGVELLTASNFCIWRSTVLRCGCASKIPTVIEITVVSNKTGVPDAIALEVELQMGPDLSYIISQHVGLLNKSAEASTGILKTSLTRPQA